MGVKVMNWVWSESVSTGIDRLVLLAIADFAQDDGTNAYPSISTLANKAAIDARTVQRSIRRLCAIGELEISEGTGPKGVNEYVMTLAPGTLPGGAVPGWRAAGVAESPEGVAESPKRGGAVPPKPSGTIKEPSESGARKRGHRLPDDFALTDDDRKYARDKGIDPDYAFEGFCLHWWNETGAKANKLNWHLAWKTWVRNEIKYGNKGRHSSAVPSTSWVPPDSELAYLEL